MQIISSIDHQQELTGEKEPFNEIWLLQFIHEIFKYQSAEWTKSILCLFSCTFISSNSFLWFNFYNCFFWEWRGGTHVFLFQNSMEITSSVFAERYWPTFLSALDVYIVLAVFFKMTSDTVNGSHNVSLPIILKSIKVVNYFNLHV